MSLTREVVRQRLDQVMSLLKNDVSTAACCLVALNQSIFEKKYKTDEEELSLMLQAVNHIKMHIPTNFYSLLAQALVAERSGDHDLVIKSYQSAEEKSPEQWYVFAYHARWLIDRGQHLEAIDLFIRAKKSLRRFEYLAKDIFMLKGNLAKLDSILMDISPTQIDKYTLTVSRALEFSQESEKQMEIELAIHYVLKARSLISPSYFSKTDSTTKDFFADRLDELKKKLSYCHQKELGKDWVTLFGPRTRKESLNVVEQKSSLALHK